MSPEKAFWQYWKKRWPNTSTDERKLVNSANYQETRAAFLAGFESGGKENGEKWFVIYFHDKYGDERHEQKTKLEATSADSARDIFQEKYGNDTTIHSIELDPSNK